MKKIISLCLLLSSLMIYSQNRKTDLQNEGLKGKVKSIRTIPYEVVEGFGEIEKGRMLSFFDGNNNIEYDIHGNIIKESKYFEDGSLSEETIYHYDQKGRNITKEVKNSGKFATTDKCISHYNEQENKREMLCENLKFVYRYDSQGNQIEESWYWVNNNELGIKYTYHYDDKGNRIERNRYNSDNSLDAKWVFGYDDKGNMVEENMYNTDGSLYIKYAYQYDNKGNMVEEKRYNADGMGSKSTYQYLYDDQDNWVEKLKYRDDKPIEITTREIEYYK